MICSKQFQPLIEEENIEHRTERIRPFDVGRSLFSVRCFIFLVAIFLASFAFGQEPDEPETGEELAKELRTMQPGANAEISGIMKIRSPERRADIPIISRTVTNENSWQMIYEVFATTNAPAEKLIVIHSPNGPNKYLYARAATLKDPLPRPKPVDPSKTAIPLAGSDFWLSELGFDFLHWPIQNKLPGEMRLGQACYVLESIHPDAPVVVRVKSWIDKDSGGPLIAEGYDRNKKMIKEFSLAGSSFKKVNGQWQLRKMKIRSPRKDSETVLEFDLPEERKE